VVKKFIDIQILNNILGNLLPKKLLKHSNFNDYGGCSVKEKILNQIYFEGGLGESKS